MQARHPIMTNTPGRDLGFGVEHMPPISRLEETVVHVLEETRSVADTARQLHLSVGDVQRVAMMAFGLGRLEVSLSDY